MNPGSFYNPYLYSTSSPMFKASGGLFSKGLLKGANWSGFLTTAGKTLNVINQAIPVFYQVKPIWNNAKTMFRVAREISSSNSSSINSSSNSNNASNNTANTNTETNINSQEKESDNSPTFFI